MNRFLMAVSLVLAASSAAFAQSDPVFDENTVATYRITMNPAEWDLIVNDPSGAGVSWKRCTFQWQGETVTDVAIRASRTYNPGTAKPTIRLKFDEFVPDRRWRDLDALKLDSMVGNTDPTMMRERLAMWVHRQMGLIAPRSCHGRLYVNGDFKGLYEVLEPVRKELIRHRLGLPNPDGNLYEVDLFDDQGNLHPIPFDHYAWRGGDPATYVPSIFHPQTNSVTGDYRDIVAMIEAFNRPQGEKRAALDAVINLDAFYGFLASIMACSNFDSLPQWFAEPNNHYWYHREDTGKIEIVTWDQDTCFVNEDLNWAGIPSSANMSIWYKFETTVATSWLPNDAAASQAYFAKLQQILNGPFSSIQSRIDFIYNQIRSHVEADPNKVMTLGTFDAMVADLRNNWIPARIASLRSQLPANTGTNNAQFIAQTVPATMTAGQTYTVSVTMRNSGTTTWTDGTTYHLRSQNPTFNNTWGVDRATLAGGDSIAPNQDKVFSWTVTAPATEGTYNFQWQMRQSSAGQFFGDLTPNVAIAVSLAPPPPPPPTTNNAQFIAQTVPATMTAGQTYTVSVTMSNNGTSTWTDAGTYHLRSQNPSFNTTWGVDRATLAAGDSIAPGQQKVFTWTVTAPAAAGTYDFQFQMRQSSAGQFFGDLTPNVAVVVATTPPPPPPPTTNNAQFVSQTVPATMTAGQAYTVSVTMSNTGTSTWTDAETYHLRSQNPSFNTTWGVDRATLAAADSIAPGQQKVFTWTVTAPAAAGTYNFQLQMRQSSAGTFFGDLTPNVAVVVSTTPPPPPPPTTNNAQFVSQTVPTTMTAGAAYTVTVTMRNTGTTTWTDAETYHLRSQNPPKNFAWTADRSSLAAGDAIAPNQEKVFSWTVTAPAAAGTYDFQWQMRQSSADAWFGDLTPNVVVTVTTATLGNGSLFVDQSVPTTMTAGQTYTVSVTMRNMGSTTWTEAGGYRLASQNPQDNLTWGMNRVPLPAGSSIAPGQNAVYQWTVTAPAAPGTYDFQWQMRQSGVEFFGPLTPNIVVTVTTTPPPTGTNDAAFVSQNAPTAMDIGETIAVSVTMRNTGTTTWTEAAAYRLSSRGPRDNTTWGINRAYLAPGDAVAPGETVTFDFYITAPSVAGDYPFSWSLVQDGVDWFGEVSPAVVVTVTAPVGPAPGGGGGTGSDSHVWSKCGGTIALGRTPSLPLLALAAAWALLAAFGVRRK